MAFAKGLIFFFSYSPQKVIVVKIGINYQDKGKGKSPILQKNSVVSVKIPKSWAKEPMNGNDIAILKLKKRVKFILKNVKTAIMPACLPNPRIHNNVYKQKVYVAGNIRIHCLGFC